MALISCPECNAPISDTAPQCPICGYRIRRGFQHNIAWYKNATIYEFVGTSVIIISMIFGLISITSGFVGTPILGIFFILGFIIFIVGRFLPR